MKHIKTFENFLTIEKPSMISHVVEDSEGWVVIKIDDIDNAMNPEFEAKFMNYWQPEKVDSNHYAVEVGDEAGLEELRHFMNNTYGKNWSIVEEHFAEEDFEEAYNESKKNIGDRIFDLIIDTQPGRNMDKLEKQLAEINDFSKIKTRDDAYRTANSLCSGNDELCTKIFNMICRENKLKKEK